MGGFDYFGVAPASTVSRQRAAVSGQRAMTAGRKIAKTAPRLAQAIVKAGQKAFAAGGGKLPAGATSPPPTSPVKSGATSPQRPPTRLPPRPQPHAATHPTRLPPLRKTHVGDDPPADDQQVDAYTQLSDAAAKTADFMSAFQDVISQLPPDLPLVQQGQAVIEQLQNWFGDPIEKALSGSVAVQAQWTQALTDVLARIESQQDDRNRPWPWNWYAAASAYLQVHPSTKQPDTGDGSTAPAGTVAKIVVSPATTTVPASQPQQFTATCLDAAGKPVTPAQSVAWSVTAQGVAAGTTIPPTIDASGAFTATAPGNYLVTATADNVSGTANVGVQPSVGAGTSASSASVASGGGGGAPPSGFTPDPADEGDAGGDGGGGEDYAPEEDPGSVMNVDPAYSAEEGEEQADSGAEEGQMPSSEDYEMDILGRGGGGGGHGGGHGGHGGHGHGGGRGRRGSYGDWWGYGGPVYYADGVDVVDEGDIEDISSAVVDKLVAHKRRGGLEMLGAGAVQANPSVYKETFTVDSKKNEKDSKGDDVYLIHGVGNAVPFFLGSFLYTPDGIVWDVVSIDSDKKGLTVSKKKDEVSFIAWLTGDWSKLTGDIEQVDRTPPVMQSVATAANASYEAIKQSTSGYLPWAIGAGVLLGVGAIVVPVIAPIIAARNIRR